MWKASIFYSDFCHLHCFYLFRWTRSTWIALIGEVAPENVYSDRAFSFQSEIRRREAEEWIRSSTPREFSQNIAGEESLKKR